MSRVGWVVLGLILLAAGVFGVLLSGGPSRPRVRFEPTTTIPTGTAGSLAVPVAGVRRDQLVDTWGQTRAAGRVHHGTDIVAPRGTPVLAVAAGTVEKLFQSNLGGTTLYERSPDRRWTYYYAHLAGYAPGVHEGQQVVAGVPLGYVGDTGDAGPGNYHLHFGLTRTGPEEKWYQGEDVNAYPFLRAGGPLH